MRIRAFATCLFLAAPAGATGLMEDHPELLARRYQAQVRLIDGDTLAVVVFLWSGLTGIYDVRVKGVDAPETRTSCAAEKALGLKARAYVERRLRPGAADVEFGKFARRVVADIRRPYSDRMLPLRTELLRDGLAVEWDGNSPSPDWCGRLNE